MPIITELHDTRFPGTIDADITRWLAPEEIPIPDVPQGVDDTKCLDFDDSTEGLLNATDQTYGFANAWSIMQWNKMDYIDGTDNDVMFKIDCSATSTARIQCRSSANNGALLFTCGGLKTYQWDDPWTVDEWIMFLFTWDGTDLLCYLDGVETDADLITGDAAGTMTDGDRNIKIGAWDSNPQHVWAGRIHSTAIFSTTLTQEQVTDIYNGGAGGVVDLREPQGSLDQTAVDSLQHYWRHGFNASDIGEDLGNATTLIDIGDDAVNITADDIVTDSPT